MALISVAKKLETLERECPLERTPVPKGLIKTSPHYISLLLPEYSSSQSNQSSKGPLHLDITTSPLSETTKPALRKPLPPPGIPIPPQIFPPTHLSCPTPCAPREKKAQSPPARSVALYQPRLPRARARLARWSITGRCRGSLSLLHACTRARIPQTVGSMYICVLIGHRVSCYSSYWRENNRPPSRKRRGKS